MADETTQPALDAMSVNPDSSTANNQERDPRQDAGQDPSIQARLEPRRPSVRPLILVGGLSAATATLVGAALWGPLKPSAPATQPGSSTEPPESSGYDAEAEAERQPDA